MKTAILIVCLLILSAAAAKAVQEGNRAPAFQLADATGALVSLDSLKGKVILISFWATWCVSCREELAGLDRLYRQYQDRGFAVIGISVDSSAARVAAFLKKRPVGFPVLLDTQGVTSEAYRFSGLPALYLISRDSIIRYVHQGFSGELVPIYEQEINDLLLRP
jgi:peroxiredoxin